jgi:DNA-binding protein YbaB
VFDKLKAVGQLAGLLNNKDKVQGAAERVKARLGELRTEGQAGQGAVRVVASGAMRITSLELAPGLVAGMAADDRTRALAGSLIAEAVNDALAKAQAQLQATIAKEAKELGLGDMLGDLGGLV